MATPIKDTPVLRGKSAKRFLKMMRENEGKKEKPEVIARIKASYQALSAIAQNF